MNRFRKPLSSFIGFVEKITYLAFILVNMEPQY
jgi:hypothetical protein